MATTPLMKPQAPHASSGVARTATVLVMGTGSAGMRHLGALAKIDGAQALAMPMRPARRQELARVGYAVAASLQEAVRLGVQLCVVATEPGRHVEDAMVAIEQGCDVLVEKPLAPTAQQARRVSAAAAASGRRLFVGCVLRFSESLGGFREWLPAIGRPHAVRVECQSYLPDWRPHRPYRESYSARAQEGGVLRDLVHEIDYAGWIFGWPLALHARLDRLGRLGIDAEEAAELCWSTSNGAILSMRLDYLSRPARRRLSAWGERGVLEWDGIAETVTHIPVDAPPRASRSAQTRDDMFVAQLRAFIAASQGSGDARLATGADGLRALAVCDAARLANAQRREVSVVTAHAR